MDKITGDGRTVIDLLDGKTDGEQDVLLDLWMNRLVKGME